MFPISKSDLTKKAESTGVAKLTLNGWVDLNAMLMTFATALTVALKQPLVLVFCALFSFILLFLTSVDNNNTQNSKRSLANLITATRLFLVLFVLSFFNELPLMSVALLLTLCVCLDVLDGYVARKTRRSTLFGQYFDMESDALFVLAMGIYFWLVTPFGLWLLLPGLLRYAYRLFMRIAPKAGFTESKRDYAAFLAGLNFVLLLVAVPLTGWLQLAVLILSTLIVCSSFGLSFFEYFMFKTSNQEGGTK